MHELRPILFANALCVAAMMAFVAVVGPVVRGLGLAEWHGGLTVTLAGVLWMLLSRAWGRASDRLGRKKILLIGIGGFSLSYLSLAVFIDLALLQPPALLVTLGALMLTRGLIGVFYAAIPPVAAALIADTIPPQQRAGYMARLGASGAVGMVAGPLVAGALASFSLALPMYVAALLPALAWLLLWRVLPAVPPKGGPVGKALGWLDPRLRLPMITAFLAMSCVITAQVCVGFFALDRLGLDPAASARTAGYAMTGVGLSLMLAQAAVAKLRRIAPATWLWLGALTAACGFGLTTQASSQAMLIATYCIAAAGMGVLFPSMQTLTANAVQPHEQGAAAGTVSSIQGLAMVVAPLAATLLYGLDPALPYATSSLALLALVFIAWRLRPQAATAVGH